MYDIGLAAISGGTQRRSMFSGGATDHFGGHGMAGAWLGQTPQEWYSRAKGAVQDFDSYAARTAKIANQVERNRIASAFGLNDPSNKDKAQYMRDDVANTIAQVESYTPPNYLIYAVGQRSTNHVRALEDFNSDFRNQVQTAENTYGILPEPQVIEKIVTVPGAATNWTLPIVIGGGAVILAAALGLFGGGK